MLIISENTITLGILLLILLLFASIIWIAHKYFGFTDKYPLLGAFFSPNPDYPTLTIFVHESLLKGKNPIPLDSPDGIKKNYYFIASFDREGRDYLGQLPPEIFLKMYKKGYDISVYTPKQLVDIFKEVRSVTDTFFSKDKLSVDEKYFEKKIEFARGQLKYL
jgi:hypothetical protein